MGAHIENMEDIGKKKKENKNFLSSFHLNVAAFIIFVFVFLVFHAYIYYVPISKIENQFLLCMF